MNKRNSLQKISGLSLAVAMALTARPLLVEAGPLDLSDNPLEIVTGVEPNIFLLMDNSGSMDWELLVSGGEQGLIQLPEGGDDQTIYALIFPENLDWTSGYWEKVIPSEEAILDEFDKTSDPFGVWRVRYHGYNVVYYNPDVTYTPWKGVDPDGNAFDNSTPTAALMDPWQPSGTTVNLTAALADYTAHDVPDPDDLSTFADITVSGYFPARYYTWTDTDGDGVVDAEDAHTRVEIKPAPGGSDSYTRKAFNETTGLGRSDCGEDTDSDGLVTCTYTQEIQNFANWFSYYRKREHAAKASIGTVVGGVNFARIGMATINDTSSHRVGVASMNVSVSEGNKKTLLDTLYTQVPTSGGTPLRDNLDRVGRYFECTTDDIFEAGSSSSPGSAGCPVEAAPAGTCQQNYGILITDGFYNGSWSGSTDHDSDGDTDFDDGSFEDSTTGTLADIAMDYYENDLHGSLTDLVPPSSRDVSLYRGTGDLDDMHQHMATYTVAFGLTGTLGAMPSDVDATFTWPDPGSSDTNKIDDLRHAAYNGRGNFLSAANPVGLTSAMGEIFGDIAAATGAASSVAFNTQNLESNSKVYRAYYDTATDTGNLIAQKVNLDGSIDDAVLWSAAHELDARAASSSDTRVVITYQDSGATSTGIPFAWTSLTSGAGSQQDELNAPAPGSYTRPGPIGKDRLEYLRGQEQYEGPSFDNGDFRARPASAGKLGDIVHSAPVFVGTPPFVGRNTGAFPSGSESVLYSTFRSSKASRQELVYIGSNDGMLHAFDADDGSELFAYVPNLVFQNLSNLADPDYNHEYFVDLTPSVNDVFMTRDGTTGWHSVLMGGLGKGGKGYYALDITDPSTFGTEAGAADNVMWEFTEADDGGIGSSDLGYSFGKPLIAMSNVVASGQQRWVAVFGNGYNSTSADGDAALYILFLEDGQDGVWTSGSDFIKISTGYGKAESADAATPNGISGIRGVDIDLNGTLDYVYAGDLQGNLYRFDLSSTSTSDWNSSNTKLLFQARYGTGATRDIPQPVTSEPLVVKHPTDSGFIVIFGTGRWMTSDDATSTDIQSIYGVWDDLSATPLVTMYDLSNQLVEQEFTTHASPEHGFTVRTLSKNPVDYKNTGADSKKVKGWFLDLDVPVAGGGPVEYPGERAVRRLLYRGGIVFGATVIPKSSAACSDAPGGFIFGLDPLTGGIPDDIIFDISGDGNFDLEDNVGDAAGDDKKIGAMRIDHGTPGDSAFIDNVMVNETSDREVVSIETNTGGGVGTGRMSWRELKP